MSVSTDLDRLRNNTKDKLSDLLDDVNSIEQDIIKINNQSPDEYTTEFCYQMEDAKIQIADVILKLKKIKNNL